MHDGGLPSSELSEFVPGANFCILQIISILIIRGELNNYFLHLLLQLPLQIYLYVLELLFLTSLTHHWQFLYLP